MTTYAVDPARRDEAFALADAKREELKSIAGLQWIHVCDTDDVGGVMIIAQLGIVLNLWHQYLFPAEPAAAARVLDDAIAVSILAILLLTGWFRLRARL